MDRGLKAAFLFSLVVVAQADRALTAHKPSSGGLHAVALLRSIGTSSIPATLEDEASVTAFGNYMITNGNGTWTYSYYSNNGNLNGNDAGMGGDYEYYGTNPVWYNANGASGAAAADTGLAAVSADDEEVVGENTAIQAPVFLYTLGLTSIAFTGSKTGIAVGRYGGMNDWEQVTFSSGTNPTVDETGSSKLNVILTYDGATTWVRASGVPKLTAASNPAAANDPLFFGKGGIVAAQTPDAEEMPAYPTLTAGDLTSVFMASKTLGWAVGGNDVSLALAASSDATLGNTAVKMNNCAGAIQVPDNSGEKNSPLGIVLMTQNGGSVWKVVPIYISYASLLPLWKNNDPSLKNIFDTLTPGILFGVQSDASGKHVYAVGSPSTKFFAGANAPFTQIKTNADEASQVQVKSYGTILYSGNSGMSWVQQTAPTLYSGKVDYTLFAVAVQKGTTAIAVGGAAGVKYGDKSAGTIIYTMNGGFSWTQAVYPSSTGTKAPVFTSVALQPSMSGVQSVWVGGFTSRSDAATGGTTSLKEVNTATAVDLAASDFYPVAAVAGYNPTSADPVSSGVPRSKGQIYTILVSKDGGKTFAAAPTAGLPTGFVVTSFTHIDGDKLATDRSVYGITWDNAMHGWIYGYGFIMATQDGGATWVYETPADVGVTSVTPMVTAVASVPTTY